MSQAEEDDSLEGAGHEFGAEDNEENLSYAENEENDLGVGEEDLDSVSDELDRSFTESEIEVYEEFNYGYVDYDHYCQCSYVPRWSDFHLLVQQSAPYKPPSWRSEARCSGFSFGKIFNCASFLNSPLIKLCLWRKMGVMKCQFHTQERQNHTNSLIFQLLLGSEEEIKDDEGFIRGYKVLDDFHQQVKKTIFIAKMALIKELEVLMPIELPSLVLSHIIDSLEYDMTFARELENEPFMKLQDTVFTMAELFIKQNADFEPWHDSVLEAIEEFPQQIEELQSLLNDFGSEA